MRFSILIATFGREEPLHHLLVSLRQQTFRNFEVIVIDQNADDRVPRVLAEYDGDFEIHYQRSAQGHSRAFNIGLKRVTGDVVTFPDDDCWYDANLLERVMCFFELKPEWSGLTGRELVEPGFTSGFRWDRGHGRVLPRNVWRRAITFSMFLRKSVVQSLLFDESLGVGAGTIWGAGEETDYLLRAIAQGHRIYYDPSVGVWHRGRSGPYTQQIYNKASLYARGIGRVLRKHHTPAPLVAAHLIRPLGGSVLSLATGRTEKARYHWAIFRGRLSGWLDKEEFDVQPAATTITRRAES